MLLLMCCWVDRSQGHRKALRLGTGPIASALGAADAATATAGVFGWAKQEILGQGILYVAAAV